jgi:alkylation response protein AidB-like acyl-CoA dehydrogenase
MVSPQYGGAGMDAISYVLAIEEISKIDASASVVVSVNNSLVCYGLEKFGNEEQKEKYLIPLAKGECIGAFCLSEPEAGSDATSQSTTAIDMGDYYLLNGTKNWITNGGTASTYIVMAQTDAARNITVSTRLLLKREWKALPLVLKKIRWASAARIPIR